MGKPISKKEYETFNRKQRYTNVPGTSTLSVGFVRVFGSRGLLTHDQIERIKYLAKHGGEMDVREYIESELVKGMGEEE